MHIHNLVRLRHNLNINYIVIPTKNNTRAFITNAQGYKSSLYKGEELQRDVAARMALLKGQDAGNVNMSRVNEDVAIKNSGTQTKLPPNIDPTLGNASQEDVSITKVAPTSFGEFSIMNPSSEPVGNNEENAWSFNHVGLKSNSTKLSSFGAKNPKTYESIWSSGGKSFVVNDCPPIMNYEDVLIIQDASIRVETSSYADVASSKQPTSLKGESSKFNFIKIDNVFKGVELSIPRRVVENVSTRFENTLYRYFIRNQLAFLVVEYFVKNKWAKYGLKIIMLNAKGFFFFKFDSRVGLESVLERGPRMIRNNRLYLKVDYEY
nr:hypothetical protein [Tanacetum cinerariifolium]